MKISSRNQLSVILVAFGLALSACSKTVKVGPLGEQGGGAAQTGNQTPAPVAMTDGTLLTGDGAPGSDVGKDGDSYYDKKGRRMYSRAGGVWTLVDDFNNAVVSGCGEGDVILMKEGTTLEQLNARDAVKKYDIGCTVRIETFRDGVLNIKYFEKQPGRPGKDTAGLAQFNLIKEFDVRNGRDGVNGVSGGAGYDAPSDNDSAPVGSTYVQIFPQKLESGEERVIFIYFQKRLVEGVAKYMESSPRQNTGDLRGTAGTSLGFDLIEGTKVAIFLKDAQGNEIPGSRKVTDSLRGADGTSLAVETLDQSKIALFRIDASGNEIPGSRKVIELPKGQDGNGASFEILNDYSVAFFRVDTQGNEIPGTRKVTGSLKGEGGTSAMIESIGNNQIAIYRTDAQGKEIDGTRKIVELPKGADGRHAGFEIVEGNRIAMFLIDAQGNEVPGTRKVTDSLKGSDGTSAMIESIGNNQLAIYRIDAQGKEIDGSRRVVELPKAQDGKNAGFEIIEGNRIAMFLVDAQGNEVPGTRKVTDSLKGEGGTSAMIESIGNNQIAIYRVDAQGKEIDGSRKVVELPRGQDGRQAGFEIIEGNRIAMYLVDAQGNEVPGTRKVTDSLKGSDGTSVFFEQLGTSKVAIYRIDSQGKEIDGSRRELELPAGVSSEIVMGNENVEAIRDNRANESTILQITKQDRSTTMTLFKKIAGSYTLQSRSVINDGQDGKPGSDAENNNVIVPRYAFGFISPEMDSSGLKAGDFYLHDSIEGDKIVRRTYVRRAVSTPAQAGDFQQVGEPQTIDLPQQVAAAPAYIPVLNHPAERAKTDGMPVGTRYSQITPSISRAERSIQVTMNLNEFIKREGSTVELVSAGESVQVSVDLPEQEKPVVVNSSTTIRMGTPLDNDGAADGTVVYQLIDNADEAKLIPFKKVNGTYVNATELPDTQRLEILVITKPKAAVSAPISYRLITGEVDIKAIQDSAALGSVIFHSTYATEVEETDTETTVRVFNTIKTYVRSEAGYVEVSGGESKGLVMEASVAKAKPPVVVPPVDPGKPGCTEDEIIAARNTVINRSYRYQREQLDAVYLESLKNANPGPGRILDRLITNFRTREVKSSQVTYNALFPRAIGSSLLSKRIQGGVFGNIRGEADAHTYVSMDPGSLILAAVSRKRETLVGVQCPGLQENCDKVVTLKLEWSPGIQEEDFHNPDVDSYGVRRYEHFVKKSVSLMDSETREPLQIMSYAKSDAISFLDEVKTELMPKCDPAKTNFSKFKFDRIPVPSSNSQRSN